MEAGRCGFGVADALRPHQGGRAPIAARRARFSLAALAARAPAPPPPPAAAPRSSRFWPRAAARRAPPPAAAAASEAAGGAAALPAPASPALLRLAAGAYRFTRPHTMLGTAVSVASVSLLALGPAGLAAPGAAPALGAALGAALFMNIAIVGINQIYDVEIDRVNKPYLPLAAGDFGLGAAWALVAATAAGALALGAAARSPPLLATLGGSLLLGVAYSADLPLLRWKRHPAAAAACVLAVRALLVQLGFFHHMRHALAAAAGGAADLSLSAALPRSLAFATAFMLLFSVVIALFKDIPDAAGDAAAGVRTLTVRLGARRVFWACIALLEVAYLGAVAVSLTVTDPRARAAAVAAHAAAGVALLWRARRTDLGCSKAVYACYMDVWKLFYAEYALLPLLR
jgi:homogentisate phytyltransferase/homogentisate geranylgeranyltransferase